ncbi:MAG: 4-phosphoerythronate dehydrogenase [Spirochaetes bacterium]|nr:4-phosphoerythronate dehydrogenase [Spirochaetota bacterium]
MKIRIVADENIPYAREAFSTIGEVTLAKGRAITRGMLEHADALCVRSVTKVNEALLAGTPVRYVTTATIGYDHVDTDYLAGSGIGFASAPGSNANSVGEYITSAICAVGEKYGIDWRGKRIGIIGVGNVGSNVAKKVTALGLIPVLHDPPLADRTGDIRYRPREEIYDCDIITIHTPLEKAGKYPTMHLADDAFFAKLSNCTLFINSSRGKVTKQSALAAALAKGAVRHAVEDVFETEPEIHAPDIAGVTYITPHIAGYSFDGKVNGTDMNYRSVCAFFGLTPAWDARAALPPPAIPELVIDNSAGLQHALANAVFPLYDIREDDHNLRAVVSGGTGVAEKFDQLRKTYRTRREFIHTKAVLKHRDDALLQALRTLGFICE